MGVGYRREAPTERDTDDRPSKSDGNWCSSAADGLRMKRVEWLISDGHISTFQSLSAEIDRIKKENDNMQIELRHLKGEDLNSLQPKELIMIDEALDNGLTGLHEKQMEHYDRLMKTGKMLEDENKLLAFKLHQKDIALNGNMRDLELGYHPGRDFAAQMPITFRVQPSHPNLQENS